MGGQGRGAKNTLTISVDSYPSPPGDPGRKKEQIQIKPLGMPPREGSRPHARLKEMEVKPLSPADTPPTHRQAILSQGEPRDTLHSAELLPTETERKKEKKMKKKKTVFKRIATRPKALALRAQHRGWSRLAEHSRLQS